LCSRSAARKLHNYTLGEAAPGLAGHHRGVSEHGDGGLFGPDSVTWRIHGHPIAWIGGLRALYLQALHPAALRGVFTNSDYRADPWGRLIRTARYVGVTTFGSTATARAAGAQVRAVHARLRVDDPHLLRWVHSCEVDSFLDVYRRAAGLSDADTARYLAEQRRAAELVGLEDDGPLDRAELAAYFAVLRPELAVNPDTRQIARFLLLPPMPWRVRLLTPAMGGWAAVSALAFRTLPDWARRLYGVPSLPGGDLAVTLALRGLRAGVDRLPAALREGPELRAARDRIAAAGK
jgi:uncharacterized protein (DUF2236 family)